jgi:hypothetical protein
MLSIAAFFVATSLSFAPVPEAEPQLDLAALFPPAKEGFTVTSGRDPESSMSFTALLAEFTRVTGVTIQTSKETEGLLKQTRPGLNQSIQVPASEVYRIVETLLIAHDFVFLRVSNKEPPRAWRMVLSLQARGGSSLRTDALMVDEKDLKVLVDHPATLVTTTISLPKTDVRTLSNSMRTMFTDANTQQIVPVGSNSLIITGFAPNVAGLVRMLHLIDDLSPGDSNAQPPAVQVRPSGTGK